jgi:HAE1 family hydrophobic/amphiphilic exporter-1
MNISSLSVRRGVTFAMIYVIVAGFGGFSLSRLQLDLYPEITFPAVVVITGYAGASPEDIETLVTRPLEGAVAAVKGVEEINSESKNGTSVVYAEFDWDKDMEQAETDVRRQLEMVEGFLPDDADDPVVFAFDPSMQPINIMMLSGPYPQDELRLIAEDEIQPRLERIDGIATAEIAGGLVREIQVVLDPVAIEAYGLDVNQVVATVYRENTQEPGGALEQGRMDFTIQTRGKYQEVEDIGEVVVGMKPGPQGLETIRLEEVASIEDTFHEDRRIIEVDDEPAVWIIVRKQSGANTVKAGGAVMDALPDIEKEAGTELDFKVLFNQADFINDSLGNLSTTALVGMFISFFVLLLFLRNVRSALIVSTAIPTSVLATFFVMDQAGMTLNIISMAGLALAVGMLVDNAIVVLENIYRLREEGLGAWDAAIKGASGVGTAVTASTLTTLSVFVPILFVPGIAGVMFQDMAVTICFALAVSLVVALTFIPLASSRLLASEKAQRQMERLRRKDVFIHLRRAYGRALDWSLVHRWVVASAMVLVIGAAVVLAILLPTEFVAEGDDSQVFITVEAPVGSNLEQTYGIVKEVAEEVESVVPPEERKLVGLDVGVGEGFVALFGQGVHAGQIRLPLVSPGKRERDKAQIEQAIRDAVESVPGAKVTVAQPFSIMGGEGDMEIQIRGHDLATSRRVGLDLRDRLRAMPRMSEVNFSMEEQKPEVRIEFDRGKMARMGVSAAAAGAAVSTLFMGRLAGRYAEGGDEFDILVRYPKSRRLDIDEIRRTPITTNTGEVVRLANVADIRQALGPVTITRLDQERVTTITASLAEQYVDAQGETQRKDLRRGIEAVRGILEDYSWPTGFTYSIGGVAEDFMTSFKYLGVALAVSIFLVFMVMASQFESLRQPFIIIVTVPLGLVGVVTMFSVTRSTLDVSSMIGVIMLVGIAVNNGIVMIDAANQLRAEGLGRRQAIAQAARLRMRPVLMTSLTTIMAMVPLALEIGEGSEGWAGMAKSVIGGLIVSTLLTLFVVPTMYTVFARRKLKHQPASGRSSSFEPSQSTS